MRITRLRQDLLPAVKQLMEAGAPYVRARTDSDYWLYAKLFSSTCPVAVEGDIVVGAVVAFRSQDHPSDVYIQDVMIHPDHRRRGLASRLLEDVKDRASTWGCSRIYLTSEPDNQAAHVTWTSLGFRNVAGDQTVNGVSVVRDFKGAGKDRAVYQLDLQ